MSANTSERSGKRTKVPVIVASSNDTKSGRCTVPSKAALIIAKLADFSRTLIVCPGFTE